VTNKQQFGRFGEFVGEYWLAKNGFLILARNLRIQRFEMDRLVYRENVLFVVEIKTRRSEDYGYPEEAISYRKLKSLQYCRGQIAADQQQYLPRSILCAKRKTECRIGVLTIITGNNGEPDIRWYDDFTSFAG